MCRLASLLVFLSVSAKNSSKPGLCSPLSLWCVLCPSALRWDLSKTIKTGSSLPSLSLLKMGPSCTEKQWSEKPQRNVNPCSVCMEPHILLNFLSFCLFVYCVQLHTSEKSHLFPVNLQLKDRPDRFIDSPETMTGLS